MSYYVYNEGGEFYVPVKDLPAILAEIQSNEETSHITLGDDPVNDFINWVWDEAFGSAELQPLSQTVWVRALDDELVEDKYDSFHDLLMVLAPYVPEGSELRFCSSEPHDWWRLIVRDGKLRREEGYIAYLPEETGGGVMNKRHPLLTDEENMLRPGELLHVRVYNSPTGRGSTQTTWVIASTFIPARGSLPPTYVYLSWDNANSCYLLVEQCLREDREDLYLVIQFFPEEFIEASEAFKSLVEGNKHGTSD